jgi:hypothetical protein
MAPAWSLVTAGQAGGSRNAAGRKRVNHEQVKSIISDPPASLCEPASEALLLDSPRPVSRFHRDSTSPDEVVSLSLCRSGCADVNCDLASRLESQFSASPDRTARGWSWRRRRPTVAENP